MTCVFLGLQLFFAAVGFSLAANATNAENRASILRQRFGQRPAIQATKGIPGLESVLGVMGPLALAAMVSLPFVAPAAAALFPLATLSGVFGRKRRHLENRTDVDLLMRKIHAAATRRNVS